MSTAAAPRPAHRLWLPLLVLVAAPLAGAAVWHWPSDWEHGNRFMTLLALALASVFVLGFWMLFLSRFPRGLRLATVALVVAGGVVFLTVAVREVHFSGDMVPRFTFRWEKTHDDELEEHRRQQGNAPATAEGSQGKTSKEIWDGGSFSDYRGVGRDGVVLDAELSADWNARPPRQLWRQPVGGGYAGFAVNGGDAVTIEQRRDNEAVVCYDVASGKERWVYQYPAHFTERLGGPGPRATPTLRGGRKIDPGPTQVFSVGATGKLACLDRITGKEEWSADILKDNDNLPWGMAGSPLVDGQLVIVTPGAQRPGAKGRAVIAYDRETGKEVWASGDHRGAYSSPMVAELCGRRQVLSFDGDGLTGYDVKDGKELWHHPWVAMPPQYINVAQPLVLDDNRVFISSGYGVGCAMLQIKESAGQWSVEALWKNKLLRCKFTSPVYHDGYVYGLDEGVLACLDAKTGEQRWREGRYGHGQALLSKPGFGAHDGTLVILSESGDLVLVEATPKAHRELGKIQALDGKTWNPPALASGYAFLRNHQEMVCYELPGKKLGSRSAVGQDPSD